MGRKFFLRNNMQKTYPSKTFPPQNDYELKKTTNRLEKIGGSCLDCANLILFGFPSARGLYGLFQKIQRSKYRGGAGGLGTTPKARGPTKRWPFKLISAFQILKWIGPLCQFTNCACCRQQAERDGCFVAAIGWTKNGNAISCRRTNIKNTLQPNRPPKHHLSRAHIYWIYSWYSSSFFYPLFVGPL